MTGKGRSRIEKTRSQVGARERLKAAEMLGGGDAQELVVCAVEVGDKPAGRGKVLEMVYLPTGKKFYFTG